jgi:hypothetical protein
VNASPHRLRRISDPSFLIPPVKSVLLLGLPR